MRHRHQIAAVVFALVCVSVIAPARRAFADIPEKGSTPADVSPPPPQKPHGHGRDRASLEHRAEVLQSNRPSTAKQVKAGAARKAAQARIARCRLRPEICEQ